MTKKTDTEVFTMKVVEDFERDNGVVGYREKELVEKGLGPVQKLRKDRLFKRGIPYVRLGNRTIIYLRQDIIAYLKKHRVQTTTG